MILSQYKARVLLFFCLAVMAGVAIASWLDLVVDNLIIFILIWLAVGLAIFLWPKKLGLVFILIAGLLLGYWRYGLTQIIRNNDLANYLDQDIKLVGVVATEPELNDYGWKLIIKAQTLNDGEPLQGKCLLYAPMNELYNYGDELKMSVYLEPFKDTPEFSASRYYGHLGIVGICQAETMEIVAQHQGGVISEAIINLRKYLSEAVKWGLAYPEADLGAAMTLGGNNKIEGELKTAFSCSGLTHIIAISGLNVSLLVGLLFGTAIAVGLSRRSSWWLAVTAVIFYVVLVGAPASATRAGVMGVLYLTATYLGRVNKLINALAVAGAGSLLFNPLLLRDDIGWQLSFVAILGIIYLYPLLRLGLKSSWALVDWFYAAVALTVAAQLATAPIIVMSFQQLSLVAVVANLLAVWTTPFILILMFGAMILTMIYPLLWWWWPAWLLLKYLISVAVVSAQTPGASVMIAKLSPWWVVIYYGVLIILVYIFNRLKIKKVSSDKFY